MTQTDKNWWEQVSGEVPTKKSCRDHLNAFRDTCETPDKVAWTSIEQREHFPLNKWRKQP